MKNEKYDERIWEKIIDGRIETSVMLSIRVLVCLFDLILYVRSTIFQLYRDGSSWVEPVLSYESL